MRTEGYISSPMESVVRVTALTDRAARPVTMPCDGSRRRAGSNGGAPLARPTAVGIEGGTRPPMLRLLHTADVHLGARHADLGDQAVAQRERQFAAFVAGVDLALAERIDLFLIAGDLFDSNVQPRRSVERAAAQLRRL